MSTSLGSIVGGAVRPALHDSASSDQPSGSISLPYGKPQVEYQAQTNEHTTASGGDPLSNFIPPGGLHPAASGRFVDALVKDLQAIAAIAQAIHDTTKSLLSNVRC